MGWNPLSWFKKEVSVRWEALADAWGAASVQCAERQPHAAASHLTAAAACCWVQEPKPKKKICCCCPETKVRM